MTNTRAGQWLRIVSDCLAALEREQVGSRCPVVDHEIRPATAGSADDITVWCICRTRPERREFADTEQSRFVSELRRRLLAAGFPEAAVTSLVVKATSREEIDAGGGRIQG